MKLQLALDRLTIEEAIAIAEKVEHEIEWIEVGTSLIKEFGIQSIAKMKNRFPSKTIVADVKTFDNAKYEFEMCYQAGADICTVMGAAPIVTIDTCLDVAITQNKQVMIDLLNTKSENLQYIETLKNIIVCKHISKDQQEHGTLQQWGNEILSSNQKLAVAGGISLDSLADVKALDPDVLIVGSAITKADHPQQAAQTMIQIWEGLR